MDIQIYDFSEHICSTEWIDNLPNGLVNKTVDLRYTNVTIEKLEEGYVVYVGPKNVNTAGDAINIKLDENCQLLDYVIERIEPQPF